MKNWILEDEVIALICSDNSVYFYKLKEKQTVINKTKKQYKVNTLPNTPYLVTLDNKNSEFYLKIKNGELLIKSKNLPDPNAEYSVKNFHMPFLTKILEETTCVNGEFNIIFEIAFSENVPEECFFVSSAMPLWKTVLSEQRRRLFVECNRKTTKHVPGHRYDSEKYSIIYLGEFYQRHDEGKTLQNFNPNTSDKVHLFTFDIDTSCKNISDILYSKRIGNISMLEMFQSRGFSIIDHDENDYVFAIKKLPPLVDAGEVLKNDIPQIQTNEILKKCIDNYMKLNKTQDLPQYNSPVYYNNIEELYSIFAYCGNRNVLTEDPEITEKLKEIFEYNIKRITQVVPIVGRRGNTKEANVAELYRSVLFMRNNSSYNYTSIQIFGNNGYYQQFAKTLLSFYSINIVDLSLNITKEFLKELPTYKKDLDSVIEHIYYYLHAGKYDSLGSGISHVVVDKKDSVKENIKNIKYDDCIKNILTEIFENSSSKHHPFCNTYKVLNLGTIKTPFNKNIIKIDLFDIINYYGGKECIPEHIKGSLIKDPFVEIVIEFTEK